MSLEWLQNKRDAEAAKTKGDRRAVWNAMKEHMPELAEKMPEMSRLGIASIAIHDNQNNLITAWRK